MSKIKVSRPIYAYGQKVTKVLTQTLTIDSQLTFLDKIGPVIYVKSLTQAFELGLTPDQAAMSIAKLLR